jgi:peptide/nickel transport system substrate-binding protein
VFGNVAEVQTDGAYAVHFRLKPPDPFFLASLPGNIWTLHFNLTRKPFDNLKVRQAFMYAIDREQIGKSQTPPTPKRWGMLPEPFPGALTAQTMPMELRYDYDPDKAKALLKEAGFPSGFALSDFTSQRDDYLSLMLVVQEQLRQVGVNFDLKAG